MARYRLLSFFLPLVLLLLSLANGITADHHAVDGISIERRADLLQIPFASPPKVLNGGRSSTNLTHAVEWDGYSLFVKGKRIFVWSGEFHPWRLQVPDLWIDVLHKIRALGFNTISIYTHWGLMQPSKDVWDLDGFRAYQPFFDLCMKSGLWVIARPGPYINAEVSAGGIPGWVTALNATMRVNDPAFQAAWVPYWKVVGEMFAKNQVSQGGPIIMVQIENEYVINHEGDVDTEYISALYKGMREHGFKGPIFHNDVGMNRRLLDGPGAVDIYAFDSYPFAQGCENLEEWPNQVNEQYLPFFDDTAGQKGQPYFIPEFQGGWFVGYNSTEIERCNQKFGREFERVWYLHNIAQGIKLINYYMVYGGTNFGQMPFPGSGTSYDYGAAIQENRQLAEPKYSELKLMSMFVRSATDLAHTKVVGASTSLYTDRDDIMVTHLRNPDTRAGFYIARHKDSSSKNTSRFKLKVETSLGKIIIPHHQDTLIELNGRDSRIIVTDFAFGHTKLFYCTPSIFVATTVGTRDVLVVYADPGQEAEIAVKGQFYASRRSGKSQLLHRYDRQATYLNFKQQGRGISAYEINDHGHELLVLLMDTVTAYSGWQPAIDGSQDVEYPAFWNYGTNTSVLAFGPYLVRDVVAHGNTLQLTGDLNATTTLLVLAEPHIMALTWNGEKLSTRRNRWGALQSRLDGIPGDVAAMQLPALTGWRYIDSLPELADSFNDSEWMKADRWSTVNPFKPFPEFSGKYVLYAHDYGFHQGNIIYRGTFEGAGEEEAFNVSLSPGESGVGSVFLNGKLLGSGQVQAESGFNEVNMTLSIPRELVRIKEKNIIVVIVDHMGYEQTASLTGTPEDVRAPRGIRSYSLVGGSDIDWKIQGNFGGEKYPDKARSMLNEGGLFAERMGYHLPGYDDSEWETLDLGAGLTKPGLGFFRTTFELDLPDGYDVGISVVYPRNRGMFRSQLYINGWMMGKRAGDLGPQLRYPIQPGILRNGTNTIAVSLWALDDTGLTIGDDDLKLEIAGMVKTWLDMSSIHADSPGWEDRT